MKIKIPIKMVFGKEVILIKNIIEESQKLINNIYQCKNWNMIIIKDGNVREYRSMNDVCSHCNLFNMSNLFDRIDDKFNNCQFNLLSYEEIEDYICEKFLWLNTIDSIFYDNNLDFTRDNEKLKLFNETGFKFGNYVEFFIGFNLLDIEDRENKTSHCNTFDMYEFTIGDVTVKIDESYDIFKLLFKDLEHDKYFGEWKGNFTISLK